MIISSPQLAKSCIVYNLDIAFFTVFEKVNYKPTDLIRYIIGKIKVIAFSF
jgi:hypothetical protein